MNDFAEIIKFAIEREIEAETFYLEVAAKTTKEAMRGMFVGFAAEEKHHQEILKGVLERKESVLQFKEVPDYKVSESVEPAKLTEGMTMADVFTVAMKNEETAMQMYKRLADDTTSEEARRVFEGLAVMEQGHKARMEQCYTDVASNEVW